LLLFILNNLLYFYSSLAGILKMSRLNIQLSAPNARHHPPRTQRIKHPSLADEGGAIRGRMPAVVRRAEDS
jgi:hypothetical protein